MAKRRSLDTLGVAAQAKGKITKESAPDPDAGDMLTTAIHIPRSTWKLLRAVAFKRALDRGGRSSVSALLVELTEQRRKELEKEAGPYLV